MAFTQQQLDDLEELIAQGVQSYSPPGGGSITYASIPEALKLRDRIRADLGVVDTAAQRRRRTTFVKVKVNR